MDMTTVQHQPPKALSRAQERKLMEYVEDHFLEITRNFKKRSDVSSTLQTLSSYLTATHTLMSIILQIPPVNPSGSLRVTLLLRLTGDALSAIPGYKPDVETLPTLLDWLNDLDRGWLAVLRSQVWDTKSRTGIDISGEDSSSAQIPLQSPTMSQTERTRLRSLIIGGTSTMEEWLVELDTGGQDYDLVLQTLGLQQGFDDLFAGTLAEMGSFSGIMNMPEGMTGTC
ncbi:hypothetical protein BDY19DRAFT_386590 [Irpex rosettiformis]|uniref:Uncharacterized protein n=1 Tax=Irpex rosettiformis TaxID=378272 RepID=A0ACB8TVI3_9APHY|nr:hypothetical protein BDY19DRAFT_386590 [Irpex rosettiformis]